MANLSHERLCIQFRVDPYKEYVDVELVEHYRKYNPDAIRMFLMSSKDINSPANVLFGDLYRNICSYLILDDSEILYRSICDFTQCYVTDCSNFICIEHGWGDAREMDEEDSDCWWKYTRRNCDGDDHTCENHFCWEHYCEPYLRDCENCKQKEYVECNLWGGSCDEDCENNYCNAHIMVCERIVGPEQSECREGSVCGRICCIDCCLEEHFCGDEPRDYL
jgi:hypothetical protein